MATATQALTGNNAPAPNAQPNGGVPTATPSGWFDSIKDADVKTWLGTKNFPDAETAFKSHRNLESLMGADKAGRAVVLPKDDNDAEGWKAFNAKLGVPETPDGYNLPVPEGGDTEFAKVVSGWFHEAGVRQSKAQKIADNWNTWAKTQLEQIDRESEALIDQGLQTVRAEWGNKATENSELSTRGLNLFLQRTGFQDGQEAHDAVKDLQKAWGADRVAKFFLLIGQANAESSFAGGDNRGGFNLSVKDAQARIREIQTQRADGKIDNHQWRTIYEPEIMQLGKIVQAAMPR